MSVRFPRDALLKLSWDGCRHGRVTITFINRGSADSKSTVDCSRLQRIGRSFLELDDGTKLPYHRVIKITEDSRIIWERVRERPRDRRRSYAAQESTGGPPSFGPP